MIVSSHSDVVPRWLLKLSKNLQQTSNDNRTIVNSQLQTESLVDKLVQIRQLGNKSPGTTTFRPDDAPGMTHNEPDKQPETDQTYNGRG